VQDGDGTLGLRTAKVLSIIESLGLFGFTATGTLDLLDPTVLISPGLADHFGPSYLSLLASC
jgi:hypothetical protein